MGISEIIDFVYLNSPAIGCSLVLIIIVATAASSWLERVRLKGSIASPHVNRKQRPLEYIGVQNCDWCNIKAKAPPVRVALGTWTWSTPNFRPPKNQPYYGTAAFLPSGQYDAIIICDDCVKKELKRLGILEFFEIALSLPVGIIPAIIAFGLLLPFLIVFLPIKLIERIINAKKYRLEKMKNMRYACAAKIAYKLYGGNFATEWMFIIHKAKVNFPPRSPVCITVPLSQDDEYPPDELPILPY